MHVYRHPWIPTEISGFIVVACLTVPGTSKGCPRGCGTLVENHWFMHSRPKHMAKLNIYIFSQNKVIGGLVNLESKESVPALYKYTNSYRNKLYLDLVVHNLSFRKMDAELSALY